MKTQQPLLLQLPLIGANGQKYMEKKDQVKELVLLEQVPVLYTISLQSYSFFYTQIYNFDPQKFKIQKNQNQKTLFIKDILCNFLIRPLQFF